MRDKSLRNFKNIRSGANENEQGDDNEENADVLNDVMDSGESSGEKLLSKIDDEIEYEGEEQEKREINEQEESSENDDEPNNDDEASNDEEESKETTSPILKEQIKSAKKSKSKMDTERVNRIIFISDMIADYKYDVENLQWFEITFKVKIAPNTI